MPHDIIDLAKGVPEFGWSPDLLREAAANVLNGDNQYPAIAGIDGLREAVARHYSITSSASLSAANVAISAGATEALAACLLASVSPGDEVLFFEPGFVAFVPLVSRIGGVPVGVSVAFPSGGIDFEALERALTPRSRVLVFVNPANPHGTSYGRSIVERLVRFCATYNLVLVADEVWEDTVLDGAPPTSVLERPEGQVLKIGAVGKSFSVTGWKVAWIVGASALVERVVEAHALLTYAVNPVMQAAAAWALDRHRSLVDPTRKALLEARQDFVSALRAGGLSPIIGPATYFLLLDLDVEGVLLDATAFCQLMDETECIRAIPLSIFCHAPRPDRYIRLCYAKREPIRREAAARLVRSVARTQL